MARTVTCDSCGSEIAMGQQTQVILPTDGKMAGAMVDLCPACSSDVRGHPKVKQARDNFVGRMTAASQIPKE